MLWTSNCHYVAWACPFNRCDSNSWTLQCKIQKHLDLLRTQCILDIQVKVE